MCQAFQIKCGRAGSNKAENWDTRIENESVPVRRDFTGKEEPSLRGTRQGNRASEGQTALWLLAFGRARASPTSTHGAQSA